MCCELETNPECHIQHKTAVFSWRYQHDGIGEGWSDYNKLKQDYTVEFKTKIVHSVLYLEFTTEDRVLPGPVCTSFLCSEFTSYGQFSSCSVCI